jgi:hypothetical protein
VYYSLSSNPFTAIAGSATVTIIPATRAAAVINKRIRLILSATSFFPYVEAPHPDHDIKQRNGQATGRLPLFTQSPRRVIPGNLAHPRGLLVRVHGAGSCEEGEAQPGYDRIKDYARGWYG